MRNDIRVVVNVDLMEVRSDNVKYLWQDINEYYIRAVT